MTTTNATSHRSQSIRDFLAYMESTNPELVGTSKPKPVAPPAEPYTYPDGRTVLPTKLTEVVPFSLASLAARGFDPKVHVAVNLDHIEHVVDGHFRKVDLNGRPDKEWTSKPAFYKALCWPVDDETQSGPMRNPEVLTDEEFAARITEPHCESVVPGLHGPGTTGSGVYWPLCRAYDWWLGSQVMMIDIDDNEKNHPVTWERAQELFGERGLRPSFCYDTGSCRCLDGTHQRFRIVFALDEVCTDAVAVANAIEGLRDVFGADPAIHRSSYLWGGKSVIYSDYGVRMSIDGLLDAVGRSRPVSGPASDDDWVWPDDGDAKPRAAAKSKSRPHVTSGWDPFAGAEMSETFSRTDDNLREVPDFPAVVRRECQRARDIDACCDPGVTEGDERWPYRDELLTYGSNLSAYVGGNEMLVEQLGAAYEAHRGDPRWSRWDPSKWGKAWAHGMKRVPVCSSTCPHYDACDHLFTRLWRGDPVAGQTVLALLADPTLPDDTATPRRRFRQRSVAELVTTDWPEVPGLITDPRGRLLVAATDPLLVHGGWRSGKTWLLLDIALSLVTGLPLFDHFQVSETRRVVYIGAEGTVGSFADRLQQLLRIRGLTHDDLGDRLKLIIMSDQDAEAFLTIDDHRSVGLLIDDLRLDTPGVLMIDPLANFMHGEETNDGMKLVVQQVRRITQAVGCQVVVSHHDIKAGETYSKASKRSRGGGALAAGMGVISLDGQKTDDGWSIKVENDPKEGQPIPAFEVRWVTEDDDERGRPRLVRVDIDAGSGRQLTETQSKVLAALDGGWGTPPRSIRTVADAVAVSKSSVERAISDLVRLGMVEKRPEGLWASPDAAKRAEGGWRVAYGHGDVSRGVPKRLGQ